MTQPNSPNFICQALKKGIVKEVFSEVPNQTRRPSKNLEIPPWPVKSGDEEISWSFSGRIGPSPPDFHRDSRKALAGLQLGKSARLGGKALLDIEVEYLVIPRACPSQDNPGELPWGWPEAPVKVGRYYRPRLTRTITDGYQAIFPGKAK